MEEPVLRRSTRERKTIAKFVLSEDEDDDMIYNKRIKKTYDDDFKKERRVRRLPGQKVAKRTTRKPKDDDGSDSEFDGEGMVREHKRTNKKRAPKPGDPFSKVEFVLEWKRNIITQDTQTNDESHKIVKTKNIIDTPLEKHGHDIQALFVNIKWKTSHYDDGIRIEDFKKIDLPSKLMKAGIIFIWSEKQILGKLLKIMEDKGFFYVENFVIALLDASKAQVDGKKMITEGETEPSPSHVSDDTTSTTESPIKMKTEKLNESNEEFLQNMGEYFGVESENMLYDGSAEYFKTSKRVLMMFRKQATKENALELRHQRTSDALFDLVDPKLGYRDSDYRAKEYVYKMIETLLPKANYSPENTHLKMMELWADPSRPRDGWVSICEGN